MPTSLVGVNTLLPNRLVFEAISAGRFVSIRGYSKMVREVGIGNHSRIDIMLSGSGIPPCYVEVKNCTWVEEGIAQFPDAVTERGRKHMAALQRLSEQGCRAIVFFLIQRMDAQVFRAAEGVDPVYARALKQAQGAGVEVMAYDVALNLSRIRIRGPVAVEL